METDIELREDLEKYLKYLHELIAVYEPKSEVDIERVRVRKEVATVLRDILDT